MNHLKAADLLPMCVAGDLTPAEEEDLERHIERCAECSAWVATYSLLCEGLINADSDPNRCHLSGNDIATFSLSPGTLDSATRDRCSKHLDTCFVCRKESKIVQAAARGIRESESNDRRSRRSVFWPPRRSAVAAAAAALTLLVAAALIRIHPQLEQSLEGDIINGVQTVKAEDFILVETTEIRFGALLELQSPVVAFGNGFIVGTGAQLVAGGGQQQVVVPTGKK